jgi:enoyl-CoA hydratase/carnithine racemase
MRLPPAPEVRQDETVKVERENGIAWIILNRPEKRNAMTLDRARSRDEAMTRFLGDKDAR